MKLPWCFRIMGVQQGKFKTGLKKRLWEKKNPHGFWVSVSGRVFMSWTCCYIFIFALNVYFLSVSRAGNCICVLNSISVCDTRIRIKPWHYRVLLVSFLRTCICLPRMFSSFWGSLNVQLNPDADQKTWSLVRLKTYVSAWYK